MDEFRSEIIMTEKTEGWGIDRSLQNRPGVPKENPPAEGTGAHWRQPEQQIPKIKINQTVERPGLTPVFGTVAPPKGLSGLIRNFSYSNYSENQLRHWMLLLLADRVDMVEGILQDFFHGHAPNIWSEMGLQSELNNRQGWARFSRSRALGGPPAKGLIFAGIIVAGSAFYLWRRRVRRFKTI
jgi:hypothetical protein